MAARPGLAIVQTMVKQSAPGDAAEAAAWASTYGLTNVHVWADTTNYFYFNFTQYPPANSTYPSTIVLDVDTMTIAAFVAGGTSGATSAIQAILDAEHPCADY